MYGITERVYKSWRINNGLPPRDVKLIDRSEVESILYQNYWQHIRGDYLPAGVDLAAFDYAVNSGPSRSAKELQRALGVKVDGVVGNVTVRAAIDAEPVKLINDILDRRMAFLKGLSTWGTFGRGWSARVSRIRAISTAMARSPVAVTPLPPPPRPPTLPPPPPVQVPKSETTIGQVMAWIVMALFAGIAAYVGFGRQ